MGMGGPLEMTDLQRVSPCCKHAWGPFRTLQKSHPMVSVH